MFKAYLEDFHDIKIIMPSNNLVIENTLIHALNKDQTILLTLQSYEMINEELHLYLHSDLEIEPFNDITIEIAKVGKAPLLLGKITRSKLFDQKYYFNDWLGHHYERDKTTFRLWTPVAKEVKIVVDNKPYELTYSHHGMWEITILGNLNGKAYHYLFRINTTFIETLDPFAIASDANNKENYVIDLNDTYKMQYGYYFDKDFSYPNTIIYEINVRDATSKLDIKNVGTYEALTNTKNTIYGLGYLKKLGITHLQLLPVLTFGGVDENIKDSTNKDFKYNWGYNPMQYMVPSGYFATDANNPYTRINELKKLIDTIHSLNLGVNLDVVYNHVFDNNWFPFEKLVPGYTFRTDEKGYLTNSSWCGNDLKTDHLMIRKLIIDSLLFLQSFYQIDGFRFDLMGLIDIDTMNEAYTKLKKHNPCLMVYGEGWQMDVMLREDKKANINNAKKLLPYAFFNDYFRNMIRGSNDILGYLKGMPLTHDSLFKLLTGFSYFDKEFDSASQSINYVECHDNYTLYDWLCLSSMYTTDKMYLDVIRLAMGLVVLSCGIPFLHAGTELLRSKKLIDNSYNLDDEVNGINWVVKNNLTKTLQDLITLRRSLMINKLSSKVDIKKRFKLEESSNLFAIRVYTSQYEVYQIFITNRYENIDKYFAPGTTLIYDGEKIVNIEVQVFNFNAPGIYVFKK